MYAVRLVVAILHWRYTILNLYGAWFSLHTYYTLVNINIYEFFNNLTLIWDRAVVKKFFISLDSRQSPIDSKDVNGAMLSVWMDATSASLSLL